MNRWILCAALTLSSAASAQNAPSLVDTYRSVSTLLADVVKNQMTAPNQSVSKLDAAEKQIGALTLESNVIKTGLTAALKNTRVAIVRTPADLGAQVGQVKALLQKAIYDGIFSQIAQNNKVTGIVYAGLLADELKLSGTDRSALQEAINAGNNAAVQKSVEKAYLTRISSALKKANDSKKNVAYQNLAAATNDFTVIQDSPRAGELTFDDFVGALGYLTGGQVSAYQSQLGKINTNLAAFVQAAATP
ncbi:hypothetical protein [Deinococcus cellulosilyticus]|uniref:Uncharacterized protein n=1 Tax=Deinococcus cellulosilyticus (strain DSM 18568 / NBRC 106333 / KACC 11606 / 5516J-15) TaxID=1223518 RepID=A0A511N2K2_DEIC1|nr:hypothetical protein [Deinococcus cellulosilyticus]GEM47063.1 hypothetical protein DC3_26980 [Deinococcus cellulosilyticus NBRC 106333 = KACC 11606]